MIEHDAQPLSQEGLTKLAALHKAFFVDDNKTIPYRDVVNALGIATENVLDTTEPAIVTTLLEYWFEHFQARIKWKMPSTSGTLSNMIVVAHMLNEHDLVETMTGTSEHRKLLAWMCLTRIAAYELGTFHVQVDDIKAILEDWYGSHNTESGTPTLAATVALLYGPGVWELCAPDAGHMEKIPSHLYTLGLELRGPQSMALHASPESTMQVEHGSSVLPQDMA